MLRQFLRALLPIFHLPANSAQRVDGLVGLRKLLMDFHTQVELRFQLLLGCRYAWVFANLERLDERLIANGQPHAIDAWWHERACKCGLGGYIALHALRVRVAHIPDEAIRARLFGDRRPFFSRFLLLFLRIEGFIRIGGWVGKGWWRGRLQFFRLDLAAERANLPVLSIQEGECDLPGGLFFEVIADNHAVGRVLAGIEIAFHLFAVRLHFDTRGNHGSACAAVIFARFRRAGVAIVGLETSGGTRPEKVHRAILDILIYLAQGCDVVQYPERAPVGGGDEIVILDCQVVNGDDGQVALQRLPVRAIVKGDEDAQLGSGIEQAAPLRVFANDAREGISGDAIGDLCPGLPVIVGFIQVGLEVVELVARGGKVGRGRVVRRWLDDADERPFGQVFRCDVLPARAVIARDMHEAIVGTGPEQALFEWRFGEGEDGAVVFRAGIVFGNGAARGFQLRDIVACQVWTDDLPAAALVG